MKDKHVDILNAILNIAILFLPIVIGAFFITDWENFINKILVYSGSANNLALILHVTDVIILKYKAKDRIAQLEKKHRQEEDAPQFPIQPYPFNSRLQKTLYRIGKRILFLVTIVFLTLSIILAVVGVIILISPTELIIKGFYECCTYVTFIAGVISNIIIILTYKGYSIEDELKK